MFGKKKKAAPPKSSILVPLYVYPAPGAWEPLFTAITAHPTLNFIVIVNPASGPGTGSGPDGNYTRELPRLNVHPNVQTVGYVSTDYTKRDLRAILRDIKVYSAWSENATVANLGMEGIFLDETPSQFDGASAQYLETTAAGIRSSTGFGSNPMIIHNPGTIPDARYLDSCNLSVVFEGTYSTYQIYGFKDSLASFHSTAKTTRDALGVIIHNLPSTISTTDQERFLGDVRDVAGSIFVTGLSTNYYASFWEGWGAFVDEMDK